MTEYGKGSLEKRFILLKSYTSDRNLLLGPALKSPDAAYRAGSFLRKDEDNKIIKSFHNNVSKWDLSLVY